MKRIAIAAFALCICLAASAQTEKPKGAPTSTMQGKEQVKERTERADEKAREAKKAEEEARKVALEREKEAKKIERGIDEKAIEMKQEAQRMSKEKLHELPVEEQKQVLTKEAENLTKQNAALIARAEEKIKADKELLGNYDPQDERYQAIVNRIETMAQAVERLRNEEKRMMEVKP